jgi:hypothetical protein
VDAAWLQPDLDVAMVADHSPIWFTLDLRKGGQTDDSE